MDSKEEVLLKKISKMEADLQEKLDYCKMMEEINSGLRRYLNEMTGVYRLLEAMNTVKSLEKIYDLLMDILSSTVSYDGCVIYVYDDAGKEAKIVKEVNKDVVVKYKQIFSVDKSMYEWVFKKKHIAVVPKGKDVQEDTGFRIFDNKSFAIAPLFSNEKRVGYVDILIDKPANAITQQELSLMTILLNQTTVVIENLRMYEKEKEAINKLRQIDEMKSDIMTTTSHELRTPLTILKGSSRIVELKMKQGMWDDDDKKLYNELIHNVNTQAEIMEEITNTLLAATKFENGTLSLTKKVVDVKKLVEGIVKKFTYRSKNINIKFESAEESVTAFLDDEEIKKVLKNLLSNAYKFSEENSDVFVALQSDNKSFMITVRDFGPGIPQEEISNIFDKFYRLDRALTRTHGGMGFGLYISKIIVEQHGGSIWVDSQMGKGSAFYFKIPKGTNFEE
jgi:K+-sensing histidine kinase KdpD